jgi:hypothetical protein
MWQSPSLLVKWGPYFKTDPQEQLQVIQMVQAALGKTNAGGMQLISKRHAVEKIADMFGIENIDAMLKTLEEEEQEAQDAALEHATKMAAAVPPKEPDDKGPPKQ